MQVFDGNILDENISFGSFFLRHQVQTKDANMPAGIGVRQVHGDQIFEPNADYAIDDRAYYQPEAGFDAILWQHAPSRVLHIKTADCLPLVIVANNAEIYAVVHAGWRGLAANIISKTILRFKDLGVKPEALAVYIGPAICQKHYEVGEDLRSAFQHVAYAEPLLRQCFKAGNQADKYFFDLKGAALLELLVSKVSADQVQISPYCTYSEAWLPSYRRDQTVGRLITSVWRAH